MFRKVAGVGPGTELCYPKAAAPPRALPRPRGSAGFPVQSSLPCPPVSRLGFLCLVGNFVQRAILVNRVFFAILHSSSAIHSSFFYSKCFFPQPAFKSGVWGLCDAFQKCLTLSGCHACGVPHPALAVCCGEVWPTLAV